MCNPSAYLLWDNKKNVQFSKYWCNTTWKSTAFSSEMLFTFQFSINCTVCFEDVWRSLAPRREYFCLVPDQRQNRVLWSRLKLCVFFYTGNSFNQHVGSHKHFTHGPLKHLYSCPFVQLSSVIVDIKQHWVKCDLRDGCWCQTGRFKYFRNFWSSGIFMHNSRVHTDSGSLKPGS